jgi:hypothetical protein
MTDQAALEANAHPMRERHRPTHLMHRGDRLAFNRLEDGISLSRLDPYFEGEQRWKLLSGRVIFVTGAEVRDISKQVHDLDLPESRPEWQGGTDPAIYERLAAIERRLDALEARQAPDPPHDPPSSPDSSVDSGSVFGGGVADVGLERDEASPTPLPPDPQSARISDFGDVGINELLLPGETFADAVERLTPGLDELLGLGDALADASMEDVIRSMSPGKRSSWVEKLNSEKADLRTKRQTDKENFPREGQIDRLANLFARVGEKR